MYNTLWFVEHILYLYHTFDMSIHKNIGKLFSCLNYYIGITNNKIKTTLPQ